MKVMILLFSIGNVYLNLKKWFHCLQKAIWNQYDDLSVVHDKSKKHSIFLYCKLTNVMCKIKLKLKHRTTQLLLLNLKQSGILDISKEILCNWYILCCLSLFCNFSIVKLETSLHFWYSDVFNTSHFVTPILTTRHINITA